MGMGRQVQVQEDSEQLVQAVKLIGIVEMQ
jgi:hypothetical protein